MALFYMSIQFYVCLAVGVVCMMLLIFKNGNIIKNKYAASFICGAVLLLCFINYSSLPENYLAQKIGIVILSAISEIGLIINAKCEKYVKISKIALSIGILGNIILLSA